VHEVVRDAGATNAYWIWSPNTLDATKGVTLPPYYPGDAYVDWVGLSAYFSLDYNNYVGVAQKTINALDLLAPTKPIYIAETSVLPGPTRVAMINDLMTGLLSIPRLAGITWFNRDKERDYRIETDPAAAAVLGAYLRSPHFGQAGQMGQPVLAGPLRRVAPTASGAAIVGSTLTGTPGTWRSTASSGSLSSTSSWYRCTDISSTAGCAPVTPAASGAVPAYKITAADFGSFLRLGMTGKNAKGTSISWSKSSFAVLMRPQAPAGATVEARDRALRVVFPAAPAGTTHWQLTVNGVVKPLIPVDRKDAWVTGLTNGTGYSVTLAAASSSWTYRTLLSPTITGVGVPLPATSNPYVTVGPSTVRFVLPAQLPTKATWLLTVDGNTTLVSPSDRIWTSPTLPLGDHTWSLRAVVGSWAGQPNAVRSLPVSGSFTLRGP
jgi:hypothetical protein